MIRTEPAKQAVQMTKAEAQAITERIRNAVEDIRKLVAKAHEGKAWKALGHASWEAYVKAEFGMSRGHSYRLLQQGEVIAAIEDAVGDLSPIGDIPEGVTRELKRDLPAAVAEIKTRTEAGEDPAKVAKEIAVANRAEKAAQQAANEAARDETRAKLPPAVQEQDQVKADAIAARKAPKPANDSDLIASLEAEIEELREANASLEKELADLKAGHAKWEDMRLQWERGGFEKVVADLREVISVQATRIERESHDKGSWKRNADMWRKRAEEAGWSNNVVIDLDELEVVNGR